MAENTLVITADDVSSAAKKIKGHIEHTQTKQSKTLSQIVGADIFLKFEIFQFTAAYKERGALNRLLALSPEEKKNGVIAMSAGNHAQGVSYHATRLGIPATIVMPFGTPFNKVKRTEELGADVVLAGNVLEEATAEAMRLSEEKGYTFLHPFDDPLVIAGQGTVAQEMLEDIPDLDTLLIPIGGGGLISGMAVAAKAVNPNIKIIGVQTESFPSMKNAMDGSTHTFDSPTIAEGIAVKTPGTYTQAVVKKLVDDILIIPETRIEEAIVLMMEIEKVVVEGAGATGLAALMEFPEKFKGRKVGMVLTGGNIDSRLLASAIMRGMARDGRLSRLRVTMLDVPGSLAKVSEVVANVGANVLELRHQREFGAVSLKMTEMEMVIEAKDKAHADLVVVQLEEAGFIVSEAKTV
ncbi:threonine ammonia-lyase [Temperatibacter marinus]|uniref:Threonine ammonia-lyase n=1 Tax=Temperatibacter marinus TaxID=1456591 RepID=A0AA52EHR1_9PROT|nr:threonine ammonia-lyase [Temperatibacter marinus]WND02534.1 threonine ammonia-lyase [Temperatibacter marinus]